MPVCVCRRLLWKPDFFCKKEDENVVSLPLFDSDDEEEPEPKRTKAGMHGYDSDDGFIVPDDEGDNFTYADPSTLSPEAAKFVEETHQAVREFEQWQPKDKEQEGIKQFVNKLEVKATNEEHEKAFWKGKDRLRFTKPPNKK